MLLQHDLLDQEAGMIQHWKLRYKVNVEESSHVYLGVVQLGFVVKRKHSGEALTIC
jgi:hypothetical protein